MLFDEAPKVNTDSNSTMSIQELKNRFMVVSTRISDAVVTAKIASAKLESEKVVLVEKIRVLSLSAAVLSKLAELSRRDSINKVEALMSYVLQTILDDQSYRFMIQSREVKTGILYEFFYAKQGKSPVPVNDSSGGGVGDILSVFLEIIIQLMLRPKDRRFFILDERFAHLSPEYHTRIAEVIRKVADSLDCQFVIITQERMAFPAIADKVYFFSCNNRTTEVKDVSCKVSS